MCLRKLGKASGALQTMSAEKNRTSALITLEQSYSKLLDRLETLPNSHPILRVSKTNITYRYLSKWQYKIIFTVKQAKDKVIVVRLFHDKQDLEKLEELLP